MAEGDLTVTNISELVRVESKELAAAAFGAGAGGGNTLYDTNLTGAWTTAPNQGSQDTFAPAFTAESFTVQVINDTASSTGVRVRISSDNGANYGEWIMLRPGVHAFEITATHVQIDAETNGDGAQYQVAAFA